MKILIRCYWYSLVNTSIRYTFFNYVIIVIIFVITDVTDCGELSRLRYFSNDARREATHHWLIDLSNRYHVT